MHQNLAVILWQINYSKNSFIALIPVVVAAQLTGHLLPTPEVLGLHLAIPYSYLTLSYCLHFCKREKFIIAH